MNHHLMETQNLEISFDYSWFLAKHLAYAKCPIIKFHYRNSCHLYSWAVIRQMSNCRKICHWIVTYCTVYGTEKLLCPFWKSFGYFTKINKITEPDTDLSSVVTPVWHILNLTVSNIHKLVFSRGISIAMKRLTLIIGLSLGLFVLGNSAKPKAKPERPKAMYFGTARNGRLPLFFKGKL